MTNNNIAVESMVDIIELLHYCKGEYCFPRRRRGKHRSFLVWQQVKY